MTASVPQRPLITGQALRRSGPDVVVVLAILLWLTYNVNGFRPPNEELVLSDENAGSGVRQFVFTLAGIVSLRRLLITRSLSAIVALRAPLFAMGGFILLSTLWSADGTLTIRRCAIHFFGLFMLVTATHMCRRPVLLMQRTLVYFTGVVAWASILFHYSLPEACTVNPSRPGLAGISNHPNSLAPFLVIGFLLSLGMVVGKREQRLVRTAQIGQLIGAYLTNSVTSLILLTFGIGLFVLLRAGSYRRHSVQIAAAFLILCSLIVGLRTVRDEALHAVGRDASFSGRPQLWEAVIEEVAQRPLFGYGYGAFWYEGRGRELVRTWNPRQAHNAYVNVLADLGIVGIVLIIVAYHGHLWIGWLRSKGKRDSTQRRVAVSMFACGAGILTAYAFTQSFFFKLDSFPFFAFLWCILLLNNTDQNHLAAEMRLRNLPHESEPNQWRTDSTAPAPLTS